MEHQSVLLHEVLEMLAVEPGDTVVDATINGGGHSEALCKHLGNEGQLIGCDKDSQALARARDRLKGCGSRLVLCQGSFANLDSLLDTEGVAKIDKVLFDLGYSSNQLETSGRGFSFQKNEPLIMTLADNPDDESFTASDIVNSWSEESIADILYGYGEEQYARRIAKKIVEERHHGDIKDTFTLAKIVQDSVPLWYRKRKIHPATKTFQALRIAVNDELQVLETGLTKAFERLSPGGRIAVISFHSLEDRRVKTFFRGLAKEGKGTLLVKKPIVASREENLRNPRARSAKLRGIEKTE